MQMKNSNGVARTLKSYPHQRETTRSSNDSVQLHPFFEMGITFKGKNLLPEGRNSFFKEEFLIVWKITFITLSNQT